MSHHHSRYQSLCWGIMLITAGVIFLLHTTRGLDIGELISNYWPVFLILLGIYMIIQNRNQFEGDSAFDWGAGGDRSFVTDKENIIQSNTFGDVNVTVDSKDFQSGQIKTAFGDVKVDLTNLDIIEGERRLHLSTVFGDVKVNAPKDLPVKVYVSTTFGDTNIFNEKRSGFSQRHTFKSPNYDTAKKKLFITISQTFVDTKVW